MTDYLYRKLKEYVSSEFYGFHMPGHKRNGAVTGADLPYDIDITEIDGFDDLHHANGILKEAQVRAAELFHAEETHYLINGSTAGILSAIMGCTRRGDKILMARNCHKSVYNSVLLNGLWPIYLYPSTWKEAGTSGEICPDEVERFLERDADIRAVVITSPTYDGVVSDVGKIAEITHRYGIPLIVDEAHGAHFGFHPYFPKNGNELGADVVIHSLHKTLPALTQTGLLHMNGERADRDRIRACLHMLQSSSPSYVLMAGIDECVRVLAENGRELFNRYTENLEHARQRMKLLENLSILEMEHYDRSKILISVKDVYREENKEIKKFSGKDLYFTMKENYLQLEMAAPGYALAMTSIADTSEGMEQLAGVLLNIDRKLAKFVKSEEKNEKYPQDSASFPPDTERNRQVFLPCEAAQMDREYISWERCAGRVALEYAYVYPPGIPLTVPGEEISGAVAGQVRAYEDAGFQIEGTKEKKRIGVLMNG